MRKTILMLGIGITLLFPIFAGCASSSESAKDTVASVGNSDSVSTEAKENNMVSTDQKADSLALCAIPLWLVYRSRREKLRLLREQLARENRENKRLDQ